MSDLRKCDRCGTTTEDKFSFPVIGVTESQNENLRAGKHPYTGTNYDICPGCRKSFDLWLKRT